MRKITVGLELSQNPKLLFDEPYMSMLRNAVTSARGNLLSRFKAELEGPFWDENLPYPYVVVTAPDDTHITPGNVARHLRGISAALIKRNKEMSGCRVGKRVFRFLILDNREAPAKPKPVKHQYTTEELTDIWSEFEKEQNMIPCTHLCAEDVHKFLDFLRKREEANGTETKTEMW